MVRSFAGRNTGPGLNPFLADLSLSSQAVYVGRCLVTLFLTVDGMCVKNVDIVVCCFMCFLIFVISVFFKHWWSPLF